MGKAKSLKVSGMCSRNCGLKMEYTEDTVFSLPKGFCQKVSLLQLIKIFPKISKNR